MGNAKDLQIIEAAASVFLRYGFRRTTMGDIAEAAGTSRPALYLRYCNKEKIFETVLKGFAARTLDEIRSGLPAHATALEQLRFAFDCWAVRPFTMMQGSPDARDLANCSLSFAEPVITQSYAAFEAILVPILARLPAFQDGAEPTAEAVAHVLAVSVKGFKAEARDAGELKAMIDTLLTLSVPA